MHFAYTISAPKKHETRSEGVGIGGRSVPASSAVNMLFNQFCGRRVSRRHNQSTQSFFTLFLGRKTCCSLPMPTRDASSTELGEVMLRWLSSYAKMLSKVIVHRSVYARTTVGVRTYNGRCTHELRSVYANMRAHQQTIRPLQKHKLLKYLFLSRGEVFE